MARTYWFPAKRRGFGWNAPVTWQGWVVLASYLAWVQAVIVASLVFDDHDTLLLWAGIGGGTLLLLLVLLRTGEPPWPR